MMETILIPGAELYYERNFLSADQATILFDVLRTKCAWQRHRTSFGHAVPRDETYYGDPGTTYTYSRREYKPLTWLPILLALKARVEEATPALAYSNLGLPGLGYNLFSVIFTRTETTALDSMRTQSRKWGQ